MLVIHKCMLHLSWAPGPWNPLTIGYLNVAFKILLYAYNFTYNLLCQSPFLLLKSFHIWFAIQNLVTFLPFIAKPFSKSFSSQLNIFQIYLLDNISTTTTLVQATFISDLNHCNCHLNGPTPTLESCKPATWLDTYNHKSNHVTPKL